jgi:hypothetical protein
MLLIKPSDETARRKDIAAPTLEKIAAERMRAIKALEPQRSRIAKAAKDFDPKLTISLIPEEWREREVPFY